MERRDRGPVPVRPSDRRRSGSPDLPARLRPEPHELPLYPRRGERRLRGRKALGRRYRLEATAPVRHLRRERRQPRPDDRRCRLLPQREVRGARPAQPLRTEPVPRALSLQVLRRPQLEWRRRGLGLQAGLLPPVHRPPREPRNQPAAQQVRQLFYQGVAAGWVDKYQAGLSGQWIDTTDIPKGTGTRSFHSNPKGFLCEGKFVDESGVPLGPSERWCGHPPG